MERITREDEYSQLTRLVNNIRFQTRENNMVESWVLTKTLFREFDNLLLNAESLEAKVKEQNKHIRAINDDKLTLMNEIRELEKQLKFYKNSGLVADEMIQSFIDENNKLKAELATYKDNVVFDTGYYSAGTCYSKCDEIKEYFVDKSSPYNHKILVIKQEIKE